jgi:protein-tyrosine phosphatase
MIAGRFGAARRRAVSDDGSRVPHLPIDLVPERLRILFVCAGNICRSPAAEVVFRYEALCAGITRRLEIDSAGTLPWYVGNPPDYRAIEHSRRRGYDLSPLRARQVGVPDFERFDWILAMDRRVLADLEDLRPAAFRGRLGLFLELAGSPDDVEVPDPYDQGPAAFERMLDLGEKGSRLLVRRVCEPYGSAP